MVPSDPVILLSYVNMKLRDFYPDLEEFCASEAVAREALEEKLSAIGYRYDPARNQFV